MSVASISKLLSTLPYSDMQQMAAFLKKEIVPSPGQVPAEKIAEALLKWAQASPEKADTLRQEKQALEAMFGRRKKLIVEIERLPNGRGFNVEFEGHMSMQSDLRSAIGDVLDQAITYRLLTK